MSNSINHHKALQRIRASLHYAAALALKHDINLDLEVGKIFGDPQPKLVAKDFIESMDTNKIGSLLPREKLVYETIYESPNPLGIDEMLEKFAANKRTRCSRPTLTTSVKILRVLGLITQTCIEEKIKYAKT